MMRKLTKSIGALAILWAAAVIGSGCTPADRDFASGGAGGAGGAGGQGGGCPAGFIECDGNPDTVCETDTTTNMAHCGTCNNECAAVLDGNVECVAGTCSITSCNNGRDNCNNFYGDGCETNPTTSFEHCGTCGNSCEAPDAITACLGGSCQLGQCVMGKLDCDMDPKTGCEVDPTTNVDHCSACGMACTSPNAMMACTASACDFVACNQNFDDCNSVKADGCEVDLLSDPYHCTACGMSCKGGTCKAGVCYSPTLVAKVPFTAGKIAIFKNEIYIGSRVNGGSVAAVATTGGTPSILATGVSSADAITVNLDGIFIAGNAGAIRLSLDGSNKTTYSMSQTARGIAVTSTDVYWTALNTLRKSSFGLPLPSTVWSGPTNTYGLYIDGTDNMYWGVQDGSIWHSPTKGFSPEQLATGPLTPINITADAKNVYWSSIKGIHSAPIASGNISDLAASAKIGSLAVDAKHVYWTDEGSGLVQRTLKDGSGPAEVLALDQMTPHGLALDLNNVYWSTSTSNEIWSLPK